LASIHHQSLLIIHTNTDWLSRCLWCVVGVLPQYGCRYIIQVDAAHWWWLRRSTLPFVKRFECQEKCYINVINYNIKIMNNTT